MARRGVSSHGLGPVRRLLRPRLDPALQTVHPYWKLDKTEKIMVACNRWFVMVSGCESFKDRPSSPFFLLHFCLRAFQILLDSKLDNSAYQFEWNWLIQWKSYRTLCSFIDG